MENRLFRDTPSANGGHAPLFEGTQEDIDFLLREGYIVLDAKIRFDWGQTVAYYRRPDMKPRLHKPLHDLVEKGPDLVEDKNQRLAGLLREVSELIKE